MQQGKPNRWPGMCAAGCGKHVGKGEGTLAVVGGSWKAVCHGCAGKTQPIPTAALVEPPAPQSAAAAVNGGSEPENAWQSVDDAEGLVAALRRVIPPRVDEARVLELIEQHAPKPETVFRDRIIIARDQEEITLPDAPRHEIFGDVLAAAVCSLNVALVGPAGCGKTELCHQVADAMGLRFGHTGAVGSRYDLSGYRNPVGDYVSNSEFPDFFENGGMFLFDELDASVPNAALFVNTALANGSCAFPHRTIAKHPDFRAIAAMNTIGAGADQMYVGRNPLDAASRDRFVFILMDYDESLERAIYGDNEWTRYVQSFRAATRKLGVRHVVSMRAIDQGKKLLEAGMSRAKVEEYTLHKGLDNQTVTKIRHEAGRMGVAA